MHDDRTENYSFKLPHRENILVDDVNRIRDAFIAVDSELASLKATIDAKLETVNAQLAKLAETKELKKYVLYLDADGDLCQDFIEEGEQNPNFATDEEVEAMLDNIFG